MKPRLPSRPTKVAEAPVWMAASVLPAAARERYRDEFRAELCCLPPGRQLLEAAGMLRTSVALRAALQESDAFAPAVTRRSVACWWGIHHYELLNDGNEENRRSHHLECRSCHRIKEFGDDYTPVGGGWLARAFGGGGF